MTNKAIEFEDNRLQGIDKVIIRVFDIARSRDWYKTILGFEESLEDLKYKLIVFDTGSPTSLTIWETDRNIAIEKETTTYIIFKTKDANAMRLELKNKGVLVDQLIEDDFVKYFFFYDLDGNILEACQVIE